MGNRYCDYLKAILPVYIVKRKLMKAIPEDGPVQHQD